MSKRWDQNSSQDYLAPGAQLGNTRGNKNQSFKTIFPPQVLTKKLAKIMSQLYPGKKKGSRYF